MSTKRIKVVLAAIAMFAYIGVGFVSCESETLDKDGTEASLNNENSSRKAGKIDICHYDKDNDEWKVLSVNENSWDAHSMHGDVWLDQDGDGFTVFNECGVGSMDDCDDTNPEQFPGSEESQTWYFIGEDNDGDGAIVFDSIFSDCRPAGYVDFDEAVDLLDGLGNPILGDCDDDNANIYPGAPEICDDIDNNCDGRLFIRSATVEYQGVDYEASYALFGPAISIADAVWVNVTGDGCQPIEQDLTGKVAFIDRGSLTEGEECFFEVKIANAELQGAIGVIICSPEASPIMSGIGLNTVTIPSISITEAECDLLRADSELVSFTVTDSCIEEGGRNASRSALSAETAQAYIIDYEARTIRHNSTNQ